MWTQALNESTILWWKNTGSPWIEPTTSDLGAPWKVPVKAHTEKGSFQVRSPGVALA